MSENQRATRRRDGIFSGYSPDDSFYDEVFCRDGEIRPGWRDFLNAAEEIGHAELMRRWLQTQEEIQNGGIAYHVIDESVGVVRPWELDLLPQLINVDEWNHISAGVRQRADLLNRILGDLYGTQESLQSGLIPAEWLYSHPGFHRVFHGQDPPHGRFLHFYAADLARAPDGKWWVVGDRTDSPLGLGYALENRVASARMLPNAIRQFQIERLAPFFRTLQETLRALAPRHRDNPRIVLLSHGPSGPNYFEDAYLSRYLGYTLVEGGDLAVRDELVYLKTLAGLLPVDVILRRMSDEYCDPLEVRCDAGLGIPGLLQAARKGNVAVSNALGSSLVESPSLMPFLPGVARQWLNEELVLPSAATWWCGQAGAREHVAAHIKRGDLGRLSIRSAYRVGRMEERASDSLKRMSLSSLSELLEDAPRELVAQEDVKHSTSPVWADESATRWHVALRVYAVAADDSFHVMPGGLVRLEKDATPLDVSVLGGRLSKDVWVRSSGPVKHASLIDTAKKPVVLRRSGAELPSRVADNLYWFGRRIERAQCTSRLLRSAVGRLTGEADFQETEELAYMIRCLLAQDQIDPDVAAAGNGDRIQTIANKLPGAVLDEKDLGSLRATITNAHRNASLVRDRLSLDTWRTVHRMDRLMSVANDRYQDDSSLHSRFGLSELDDLVDELITLLSALDGLIGENMTRTPAWRFLDLGRRIERSVHMVSLVRAVPAKMTSEESRILEAMLEVADSFMTYRGRYLASVNRAAALDLMLTDGTNPRSLLFQLNAIADHVAFLPRDDSKPLGTHEERIASSLAHGAQMLDVEDLAAIESTDRAKLKRFLKRVTDQLPKLSNVISHRYLIHAGVPRQLSNGSQDLS